MGAGHSLVGKKLINDAVLTTTLELSMHACTVPLAGREIILGALLISVEPLLV